MSKRIIDREATIKNIVDSAGDSLKDINELKNSDDEFLVEAAELWDAEIVYK
jgi:hypothetical protein